MEVGRETRGGILGRVVAQLAIISDVRRKGLEALFRTLFSGRPHLEPSRPVGLGRKQVPALEAIAAGNVVGGAELARGGGGLGWRKLLLERAVERTVDLEG